MTEFVDRVLAMVERLTEAQPVIFAVDQGDGYTTMTRDLSPAFALHAVRAILSDLSDARPTGRRTAEDIMVDNSLAVLVGLEGDDED